MRMVVTTWLRVQAANVESSAKEFLESVNRQSIRADAMVTSGLDAVERASVFVTAAVSKPMRQLSGVLAAVRAIIESLRASAPALREPRHPGDRDSFV